MLHSVIISKLEKESGSNPNRMQDLHFGRMDEGKNE